MDEIIKFFKSIRVEDVNTFRKNMTLYTKKYGESETTKQLEKERYELYKSYIINADLYHILEQKTMFSDIYFKDSVENVCHKLITLLDYYESFNLENEIISTLYEELTNVEDPDIIKKLLTKYQDIDLNAIIKEEFQKAELNTKTQLVASLNNDKDEKYFLVHKTDHVEKEYWQNKEEPISCSLITNEDNEKTWESGKYMLVFTVNDPNEIIATSKKDLDFNQNGITINQDYLTPKDIITKTTDHNEILIKPKYPSSIACYEMSEEIKEISKELGIPVIILERKQKLQK